MNVRPGSSDADSLARPLPQRGHGMAQPGTAGRGRLLPAADAPARGTFHARWGAVGRRDEIISIDSEVETWGYSTATQSNIVDDPNATSRREIAVPGVLGLLPALSGFERDAHPCGHHGSGIARDSNVPVDGKQERVRGSGS